MTYVVDYRIRNDGMWEATSQSEGLGDWSLHAEGCDLAQKLAHAELTRRGKGRDVASILDIIHPPAESAG